MTTLLSNQSRAQSVRLRAGSQLTIVIAASSTAIVERFHGDTFVDKTGLVASQTKVFGDYPVDTEFEITCLTGSLTFIESTPTDDHSTATLVAAAVVATLAALRADAGTFAINGDVKFMSGAGVPVDYTDGTPPATGETVAGIGSVYADTTAGKLYVNGGTKAQPLWKIFTSAT